MKVLIGELGKKHKSLPLYFPFELSDKRPSRLLQGYAFKLPSAFLSLFPELSSIELADIKSGKRNPSWSRDELILALDLYMKNPASPPSKNSREVEETSELLILLSKKLGMGYSGSYRNRNGVYMKMMNFRRFDPAFVSSGKVGLKSGNKKEATVWHDFAHDRERLSAVALAIRKAIRMTSNEEMDDIEEEDVSEAEEGRLLTRLHRVRERSRKLVDRRKSLALARYGYLKCEGCGFNYEERYGERGKGFIEAHHTTPIHTLGEDNKTKLEDLALVCANCHRILHAKRPWLSMDELRKLLRKHQEPAPHTDRSQKE
jgi:5-methylcytosine-specific restriction protein A